MIYRISTAVRNAIYIILLWTGLLLILSNIHAPLTAHGQVERNIIHVAPKVSGEVSEVFVQDGQSVVIGTPLFAIDRAQYERAVKVAEAGVYSAEVSLESLKYSLSSAEKNLAAYQIQYQRDQAHYERFELLFAANEISADDRDSAEEAAKMSGFSVEAQRATIDSIKSQLGGEKGYPPLIEALANLSAAQLDLDRTTVRSGDVGTVTNLELLEGDYAAIGSTQLVIVSSQTTWLTANFDEKGLHILNGEAVYVVFDAIPGEIFRGQVTLVDQAVASSDVDGSLPADTTKDTRWIRKTQSIQARIEMEEWPPYLVSGSLATAMVVREDSYFWNSISFLTMTFISWFRYVY